MRLSEDTVKKTSLAGIFLIVIYCISLEERADRRQAAANSFAKVGLTGKSSSFWSNLSTQIDEQGMYESHMTCLRKGLEAGADTILIFEDDIIFDRFNAENFKQCTQFLAEHPSWKVLLLGALIRSSRKTDNPVHTKSQIPEPCSRIRFT